MEANRTRILKLVSEYNGLTTKISQWEAAEGSNVQVITNLKIQQAAVKKQLAEAVERMEKDQVPEGAKTILNKEIGKNDKNKNRAFVHFGTIASLPNYG